jgi:signal transduction histidine kinase
VTSQAETSSAVARQSRLLALAETGLLDSDAEEVFDRLTRLAGRLLDVPVAFIALVDEHRDFYKSAIGLEEPLASSRVLTGQSFCQYAIESSEPLVIADTAAHPIYREVPTVQTLGVAAYCGVPLIVDGEPVGSFCAVRSQPHGWSAAEVEVLTELASSAQREIQLRIALRRTEAAREDEVRAHRAKDDFLALVSHELRSPLAGIAANVQMIEMGICGPVTAHQTRALSRIRQSQDHLLALISQILEYKKLEEGGFECEVAPVRVATAIDEAGALMESQFHQRELDLTTQPADRDLVALADPRRLRQILVNLLANAAKFTLPRGSVTVRALPVEGDVEIVVADTGIGVATDDLEMIFAPFVQLRSGESRSRPGTGLGLSISRQLARRMNGDLTVESEVGVGSTFRLRLPRWRDEA